MSGEVPTVLIFGHSFVKRLHRDLKANFDPRADKYFNLRGTASLFLHGIGGRTMAELRCFVLHVVERFAPDVIISEVGTNDLVDFSPEAVGFQIESLVRQLIDSFRFGLWAFVMLFHVALKQRCSLGVQIFLGSISASYWILYPTFFVGLTSHFLILLRISTKQMVFTLILPGNIICITVTRAPS